MRKAIVGTLLLVLFAVSGATVLRNQALTVTEIQTEAVEAEVASEGEGTTLSCDASSLLLASNSSAAEVDCTQCGGPTCRNGSCGGGFCCYSYQTCVGGFCMPD